MLCLPLQVVLYQSIEIKICGKKNTYGELSIEYLEG